MFGTNPLIQQHSRKIILVICVIAFQFFLNAFDGDSKSLQQIQWLDISGEGSVMVMVLAWIVMVLSSRPAGHVTDKLFIGLTCMSVALFQDVMDELFVIPEHHIWDAWFESAPMPLGLVFLMLGIHGWHKEQIAINQQLAKRERVFRDHRDLDSLTGVAKVGYVKKHIERELSMIPSTQQPLSILMFDVDRFDDFNRAHGHTEGDRFLQELSELLLLNIRRCDLLCRYAGDRFVVLLPNTGLQMARLQSQQLQQACEHFAYKTSDGETIFITMTVGVKTAMQGDAETLLAEVNQLLLRKKNDKYSQSKQQVA